MECNTISSDNVSIFFFWEYSGKIDSNSCSCNHRHVITPNYKQKYTERA